MQAFPEESEMFELMKIAFEVASQRGLQDERERLGSIQAVEQIGQKPKGA